MKENNVKFGTTEYARLTDSEQFLVVEREINELLSDKNDGTVGARYNDGNTIKNVRVPKGKEKKFYALTEAKKALRKRLEGKIQLSDILQQAKVKEEKDNGDMILPIDEIASFNKRKVPSLYDDGDDLVINLPNREVKQVDFNEKDSKKVFDDFFEKTLPVQENIGKYKIVLDDDKKEEKLEIFDLDLSKVMNREEEKEEDTYGKEEIKERKPLFGFFKRHKSKKQTSSNSNLYVGKYEKKDSLKVNGNSDGKFLKTESKNKVRKNKDSKFKKFINNIFNKKGNFINDNSKNVLISSNGKHLKDSNKEKEVNKTYGKHENPNGKIVNSSKNGIFLKPKKEKKKNNYLKRTVIAAMFAAVSFLGMFTISGAKRGKTDKVSTDDRNSVYETYDDNIETSTTESKEEYESTVVESTSVTENVTETDNIQINNVVEENDNVEKEEPTNNINVYDEEQEEYIAIGDVVMLKEGSRIYGGLYSAVNDVNSQKPYHGYDYERTILEKDYSLNGEILRAFTEEQAQEYISKGATFVSCRVIRSDLLNDSTNTRNVLGEGYYLADALVKVENNAKVRVKSR